jgi:hypothetical protein
MIYSDPIYRFNIAKQRPLLFKKFQNHNFIFSGDKGPTGDQGIYTVALWDYDSFKIGSIKVHLCIWTGQTLDVGTMAYLQENRAYGNH